MLFYIFLLFLKLLFSGGQGFVRENRDRINRVSQGRNDYALKLMEQQRQQTTLDFMLVSMLLVGL